MIEPVESGVNPAIEGQIATVGDYLLSNAITIIPEVFYDRPQFDGRGRIDPTAQVIEERFRFTSADGDCLGTTVVREGEVVTIIEADEMRLRLQTLGLAGTMKQFSRILRAVGGDFYHLALDPLHDVIDHIEDSQTPDLE